VDEPAERSILAGRARGGGAGAPLVRSVEMEAEVRSSRPNTGDTDWTAFSLASGAPGGSPAGAGAAVAERFADTDPWHDGRHARALALFSKRQQAAELGLKPRTTRAGRRVLRRGAVEDPEALLDAALKVLPAPRAPRPAPRFATRAAFLAAPRRPPWMCIDASNLADLRCRARRGR